MRVCWELLEEVAQAKGLVSYIRTLNNMIVDLQMRLGSTGLVSYYSFLGHYFACCAVSVPRSVWIGPKMILGPLSANQIKPACWSHMFADGNIGWCSIGGRMQ